MSLLSLTCLLLCGYVAAQSTNLRPVLKSVCSYEFDQGNCKALINVWTYNAARGGCVRAVYGGCGGNDNRFATKQLCETQCLPVNICKLKFDPGFCFAKLAVYTYDSKSRQCVKAYYGGCNGNSNRFSSKPECEAFCKVKVVG